MGPKTFIVDGYELCLECAQKELDTMIVGFHTLEVMEPEPGELCNFCRKPLKGDE